MNERRISFGPGAASLILVIVTLCLSLLGLLSLSSARNDLSLSQAAARVSEQVYTAMSQAENTLAALDDILTGCASQALNDEEYLALVEEALPEGMEMEGRIVSFTQTVENRTLYASLRLADLGAFPRLTWVDHRTIVEDDI